MALAAIIAFAGPTSGEMQAAFRPGRRTLAFAAAAALICMLYLNSIVSQGFLYRDF